VISAAAAVF